MIDSHCHLTYISKLSRDIELIIKNANKVGIRYFVDIGVNPEDIATRMDLLCGFEGVFLTAGYYPDYANEYDEDDIKAFKMTIDLANKHKKHLYAIGEIGLDYNHNTENKQSQKKFFTELLNLAKSVDLPVIIHSREAFEDTFKILSEADVPKRGILHCFSGGVEEAKKALDLGYLISFSGSITYLRSNQIREAAVYVPNDMFTIETDSPYLTPQKLRGRANEPSFIIHTAEVLADLKHISVESTMQAALENTSRVLELDIV